MSTNKGTPMDSVFLVFHVEYPFHDDSRDNVIGDEFSKVFHTREDAEEYIKKTDVSDVKEWEIKEIPFG